MNESLTIKSFKMAGFAILYTMFFILFFKTFKLTAPFVIGLLVSSILIRPAKYLIKKLNIKSGVVVSLIVTLFYLATSIGLIAFVTAILIQVENVLSIINTNGLSTLLKNQFDYLIDIYKNLDPSALAFIEENIPKVASSITNVTVNIFKNTLDVGFGLISNIPYIITTIIFSVISTFFILKNMVDGSYENHPVVKSSKFELIKNAKSMIFRYCFSFVAVTFSTFVQVLVLLIATRVPNALLLSLIASLLDILPIVGMAVLLIPLGIYYLFIGEVFKGSVILIGYGVICIVRQVIEPKIMAKTLNISPLQSLMAIFIGVYSNGLIGIIYCIFLIVFYKAFCEQKESPVEKDVAMSVSEKK